MEEGVGRQDPRKDSEPNAVVTAVAANWGNEPDVVFGLGLVARAVGIELAEAAVGAGLVGLAAAEIVVDVADSAVGADLVGYVIAEAASAGMMGVLTTLVVVTGLAPVVLVAAAGRQVRSQGLACCQCCY